jgi:putative heme-binding domain-containing protein
MLIQFASRKNVSSGLRSEALAAIGTWANPSILDRVDGYYRGEVKRDPSVVIYKVNTKAMEFLSDKDPMVVKAASQMLTDLNVSDFNSTLAQMAKSNPSEEVRAAIIKNLHALKFNDMEAVIKSGMNDKHETVRATAIGLLGDLEISKEALPSVVKPIFEKGSVAEQQQLLNVLGKMPLDKTETILEDVMNKVIDKKLSAAISLELVEAINNSKSQKLIDKIPSIEGEGLAKGEYAGTLLGGNRRAGAGYFFWNSTGQCARCHTIGESGGKVGPNLSNIGNILSREQILEALIDPSARLSPGFGTVKVTLADGAEVTGTLMEENDRHLILKTSDAEPLEVELSRISKRQNMPSGMPPMGKAMSKKEIRDVIEFLSNQNIEK